MPACCKTGNCSVDNDSTGVGSGVVKSGIKAYFQNDLSMSRKFKSIVRAIALRRVPNIDEIVEVRKLFLLYMS